MKISDEIKNTFKRWGVAFLIGAMLGVYIGETRMTYFIKKDCQILGMFRFGDIAFGCRMSNL